MNVWLFIEELSYTILYSIGAEESNISYVQAFVEHEDLSLYGIDALVTRTWYEIGCFLSSDSKGEGSIVVILHLIFKFYNSSLAFSILETEK